MILLQYLRTSELKSSFSSPGPALPVSTWLGWKATELWLRQAGALSSCCQQGLLQPCSTSFSDMRANKVYRALCSVKVLSKHEGFQVQMKVLN